MLRAIGDGDMPDYTGKKVIVIGGGNVAMDVATFFNKTWCEQGKHCIQKT